MVDTSKIPPERIEVNWNEIGRDYTDKEINKSRTNCIISSPNNIKLEINDNSIVLKSGSKAYDAKGNVININSDISLVYDYVANNIFVSVNKQGTATFFSYNLYSQDTPPNEEIIRRRFWYDTSTSTMKMAAPNSTEYEECSLPIMIVDCISENKFNLKSVLDLFSICDSTYFLLPGTKFLFADGYNDDKSVKNIEWISDKVYSANRTWNVTTPQKLFILYNHSSKIWFENNYFVQEEEPTIKVYTIWYKPSVRKTYYWGGLTDPQEWREYPAIYINHDLETKSEISNFNFRTPFTVTDSNDVNILSSIASKPGNKYIDLSLEASETLYTAPFNGVMLFFAKPTGSGYIQLENITSSVIQQISFTSIVDHAVYVPVLAGDQIYVRYSNVELSQEYNRLRFIADKGVN